MYVSFDLSIGVGGGFVDGWQKEDVSIEYFSTCTNSPVIEVPVTYKNLNTTLAAQSVDRGSRAHRPRCGPLSELLFGGRRASLADWIPLTGCLFAECVESPWHVMDGVGDLLINGRWISSHANYYYYNSVLFIPSPPHPDLTAPDSTSNEIISYQRALIDLIMTRPGIRRHAAFWASKSLYAEPHFLPVMLRFYSAAACDFHYWSP